MGGKMASHTSLPSTVTSVDVPLLFSMEKPEPVEPSLTGSTEGLKGS